MPSGSIPPGAALAAASLGCGTTRQIFLIPIQDGQLGQPLFGSPNSLAHSALATQARSGVSGYYEPSPHRGVTPRARSGWCEPVADLGGSPAGVLAMESERHEALGRAADRWLRPCHEEASAWLDFHAFASRLSKAASLAEQPPSWAFARTLSRLRRYLDLFPEHPLLLEGETGVGKEALAHYVHWRVFGEDRPFLAINCAALPTELIEGELFGHRRGAYTGAERDRPGLVEKAAGGTLFLDEIEELPPRVQAVLLRFLDSGEFRRVGENRTRHVAAKVVASSNVPLASLSKTSGFRVDLYHRLARCAVTLPPLCLRLEEVPGLALHLLRRAGVERELSAGSMELLLNLFLPGNVRQLENLLLAAAIDCKDGESIQEETLARTVKRLNVSADLRSRVPASDWKRMHRAAELRVQLLLPARTLV